MINNILALFLAVPFVVFMGICVSELLPVKVKGSYNQAVEMASDLRRMRKSNELLLY